MPSNDLPREAAKDNQLAPQSGEVAKDICFPKYLCVLVEVKATQRVGLRVSDENLKWCVKKLKLVYLDCSSGDIVLMLRGNADALRVNRCRSKVVAVSFRVENGVEVVIICVVNGDAEPIGDLWENNVQNQGCVIATRIPEGNNLLMFRINCGEKGILELEWGDPRHGWKGGVKWPSESKLIDRHQRVKTWIVEKAPPPASVRWSALLGPRLQSVFWTPEGQAASGLLGRRPCVAPRRA